MILNTRFNPTMNGPLHIGHVFNILVNRTEAERHQGKFGIRFDDNQRANVWMYGWDKIKSFIDSVKEDMEWLGIVPDWYSRQSEWEGRIADLLENEFHYQCSEAHFGYPYVPDVIGIDQVWYPYTERLTCEKVIMDHLEGIRWVIRGYDLLVEDCFYRFFTDKFGLPTPYMTYIPRLIFEGDVVSKTDGRFPVNRFREKGMHPSELIARLAQDCLTQEGWLVEHVKAHPVLGSWADEVLHGIP